MSILADPNNADFVSSVQQVILAQNLDKRRKVSAKRTSDELELYKDVVWGLVDTIRTYEPFDLAALTDLIRGHASISQIAEHLHRRNEARPDHSGSLRSRPEEQSPVSDELENVVERDYFLVRIPASPWTGVTEDSQLVSYLVSLYLTWHHPLFSVFDADLFLQEAQAEKPHSMLCSSFLINAVLAMGWQFAKQEPAGSGHEKKNTLGDQFYNEALRLWSLQMGKPSLPNLSALAIMAQLACLRGLDKLGVMFLAQATVIYREICLPHRLHPGQNSLTREEMERSLSAAAWGFNMTQSQGDLKLIRTSLFLYILMKPTRLRIPQLPRPSQRMIVARNSEWTPYPRREPQQTHPNLFVDCVCSLTEIVMDIQDKIFDDEYPITFQQYQGSVIKYQNLLNQWYSGLPAELDINRAPYSHYICLRLVFHSIFIILFIKARRDETTDNEFFFAARNAKIRNAHELAALCNRHTSLYGFNTRPVMVSQASYIAIMILLEDVDELQSHQALIDMCVLLRAAGSSIYVAKGMLRMVKPTAAKLEKQLPPEVQKLLDDFESEEWEDADYRKFSSGYPNYALEENLISEDSFEMSDLLRRFESQARLRVWE
ncbi:MAG: hypothetical protein Q9160_006832 [Pyrenula sp. 1 TL-2023]